jgi:molybdopterin synthase catalytic subunit
MPGTDRPNVTVLFFASLRQAIGLDKLAIEFEPGDHLDDLRRELIARYPQAERHFGHARWAVNERFVESDEPLNDGDTVAVILPVSGGGEPQPGHAESIIVELTDAPIDSQALIERVSTPSCGAVCLFLGTVREFTQDKRTTWLVYEAYPDMALKQMRAILEEAAARWPVPRLGVIHRLGRLDLGEVSIAVAVATPHRGESFEACRWIMDTLKERVPIWKQEHWADGSTEWVHPTGS